MVAIVHTGAPVGYDGHLVRVESDLINGLPGLQIVGLGNKAVDEAKDRVRSAINNSLLDFPKKKITINLAPAELPKDGAHYDLPIALSILCASSQLTPAEVPANALFAGELGLDGGIRPIRGAVSIAEYAASHSFTHIYLPAANAAQAGLVEGIEIIPLTNLKELFLHLKSEKKLLPFDRGSIPTIATQDETSPLLDEVRGQAQAKRALTIAAAGHHNILLSGSPGTGKSMLSKVLVGLLPELTRKEQLEITKLYSLSGEKIDDIVSTRPFRSPHHTASKVSIIGGGNKPKPGEISLAHLGVLLLDELLEYPRSTLESLRQPLEDRHISVSRVEGHATYPADFMLVGTMNPCPCGYFGDATRECSCTSNQILNYQKRLSGPLLDRIDLRVSVSKVPHSSILADTLQSNTEHSQAKQLIERARNKQAMRFSDSARTNASMTNREIKKYAHLSDEAKKILDKAAEKLDLNPRSYIRIVKVARTIADLADRDEISIQDISEALQYRG